MFSLIVSLGAVSILVVAFGYAAPITIDTFDIGTQFVCDPYTIPVCTYGDKSSIATAASLGGYRDISITHKSGAGTLTLFADVSDSNQLKFSQDSDVLGHSRVVWDGDNDAASIDTIGLNGKDLTDGNTNDGFQILVYSAEKSSDNGKVFDLIVSVITATNSSAYTLTLNQAVSPPGQAFFIPFNDFTVASGTGAVFTSTGAIVFDIIPGDVSIDLTLDLFEATSQTDWGDLPDTYSTTLSTNGARHIVTDTNALFLGSQVDLEGNGFPSLNADGDNINNYDDEQGVEQAGTNAGGNPGWQNGSNGGAVTVTVGSNAGGCLSGWLDWDQNGKFDQTDEKIIDNQAVANGPQLITFDVPAGTFGSAGTDYNFYSRFRIFPDVGAVGCANDPLSVDYFGEVTGGEVEDYLWKYSRPTAVNLQSFSAGPGSSLPVYGVIGFAALVMVGLVALALRRERKQA